MLSAYLKVSSHYIQFTHISLPLHIMHQSQLYPWCSYSICHGLKDITGTGEDKLNICPCSKGRDKGNTQTAPTPQNIILMVVEKHILIIWNVSEMSSNNSPSVHILHHHFRGGGGSRAMMMLMTQGEVGGPKMAQSWWCNMCTLPNSSDRWGP